MYTLIMVYTVHTNNAVQGDGNEHSKKTNEVRHKELLEYAAPPVLNHIIEVTVDSLFYFDKLPWNGLMPWPSI